MFEIFIIKKNLLIRCSHCDRCFGQQTNLDRHLKNAKGHNEEINKIPVDSITNRKKNSFSSINKPIFIKNNKKLQNGGGNNNNMFSSISNFLSSQCQKEFLDNEN
ncbi:hypothetical protein Mgra_00002670 [Meloidogyne graminicola]|uniref:C2H2-type domain-containing protein n=1 Tax=Meloidogyne graminicola TaxID=189291 RepID=A0A8S9ZY85_9BILA|nr:hypothetical protein Mgra_00002670 [Meloidogyne graminicola]